MKKEIDYSDLIGKPYQAGGRGPDAYDCWGIVMEAAKRAGINLPELDIPQELDHRAEMVTEQKKGGWTKLLAAKPYCVVLFRIIDDNAKERWHCGLMISSMKFIHTTKKMGVNISDIRLRHWDIFREGYYENRIQ